MGASTFLRVLLGREDFKQLQHLEASFQLLAEILEAVENYGQMIDLGARNWLVQVESALSDISDILDELKMEEGALFKPRVKLAQAYRIKTVRRVLDELVKAGRGWKPFQPTVSDRQDDESVQLLAGRESSKSRIIDLVLASVDDKFSSVSVLPLVGFMGIGKTALARSVYLDSRIRGYFNVTLWVSLAGEVPGMFDILKQVTQLATDQDQPDRLSLTKLLPEGRKNLLIVLDDCREDRRRVAFTRELVDILPWGSAIIITTRSERVAALCGTMPPYQLERLSLDDSLELFKRCSSAAASTEYVGATEIFKLCRGIPRIVKAIGTFLFAINPRQWRTELSRLQDETGKDITPYFASNCFDGLPSYLKHLVWTFRVQTSCRLTVDELICLWIALGFLSCESDDPTLQPEYIARKYLKEFAKTALFTNVGYAPGGFIREMVLDDLVCDLAMPRARDQVMVHGHSAISRKKDNRAYSIWDTVHITGEPIPSSSMPNPNKTRLFMVCHGRQVSKQLVRDVVSNFKCLRVLGIGESDTGMLPDAIGSLKHLRYLDLGKNSQMRKLPDSICQLWYLQTLLLSGCRQLEQIPENIGRLHNLRYLTLSTRQASLPEQIGLLSSLKTLGLASCPRLKSLPRSVVNLKSLETLGIVDCQVFELETSSVNRLKWVNGGTLLLSGLPKLEHFPMSIGNANFSLKHLMIQSCETLKDTIWIHQLRSLCSVTIEDCPNLSNLTDGACQFHNTVELVIRGCPSLTDTAWIRHFVSLRSLVVDDCPNILALDGCFSGLKYLERLEIRRCPHLTNRCVTPGGEDWPLISHVLFIELGD